MEIQIDSTVYFLSQAVNQDLIAAPLVPPQLTAKDFYMTGKFYFLDKTDIKIRNIEM